MNFSSYIKIVNILLFYFSIAIAQYEQKSTDDSDIKVLFIGNSLTGENMPEMVFELTKNSGYNIYTDKIIRPGRSLLEISSNNLFTEKISSENWDYLIMQDSPYRVAYPKDFNTYPTRTALTSIIDLVSEMDITLIFFMPYAYKDGMSWYVNYTDDFFEMQEKIYDNSLVFGSDFNLKIAPVGWAWYNVMLENNGIELFLADLTHPTTEGKYLTACVIYSTLFEEPLLNNQYISSISSTSAIYLQTIASSTVIDELDRWNFLHLEDNHDYCTNFNLYQNYPNPFNSNTTILFEIKEKTNVEIFIYDISGKKIKDLISHSLSRGMHHHYWDGTDDFGTNVGSGIYFYSIITDNYIITKKMLLLR